MKRLPIVFLMWLCLPGSITIAQDKGAGKVDAGPSVKRSAVEIRAMIDLYEEQRKAGTISDQQYKELVAGLLFETAGVSPESEPQEMPVGKPSFCCNYSGKPFSLEGRAPHNLSESGEVLEAVEKILDAVSLSPNFVVRAANVPSAQAAIYGQERYVRYSTSFMRDLERITGTDWAGYSVLAHEIGHHLEGHTLMSGGSQPHLELKADRWSGWVLALLGAPLEESQAAMKAIASSGATATHPARADRLEEIRKGWQRGHGQSRLPEEPEEHEEEWVRVPCRHTTRCTHRMPCTHTIPCQHRIACQHRIPCQHIFVTPMGPRAMHPFDTLHPFHFAHPFDTQHPYDLAHPHDLLHPEGDLVRKTEVDG